MATYDLEKLEVTFNGRPLAEFTADDSISFPQGEGMEAPCFDCSGLWNGTARPVGVPWPPLPFHVYTYVCGTCQRRYDANSHGRWHQVQTILLSSEQGGQRPQDGAGGAHGGEDDQGDVSG